MPTYEYECASCEHNFEVFQSMMDAALTICPNCGKRVRRIIGGGTGIIFKGSGFYVNDSKKASAPSQKGAASDSPAAAGGPAKPESPSKPDSSAKPDSPAKTGSPAKTESPRNKEALRDHTG
jgi:putative FmdB family regulatory protein